jgi:hypothetical protein
MPTTAEETLTRTKDVFPTENRGGGTAPSLPERKKTAPTSGIVLLAFLSLFPTAEVVASYYANAVLQVVVLEPGGPPEPLEGGTLVRMPVRFLVTRFLSGDGHDPRHGERLVGSFQGPLPVACPPGETAQFRPGAVLTLRYHYSNALGFDPTTGRIKECSGEQWQLDTP